jgi:hypothetical protein
MDFVLEIVGLGALLFAAFLGNRVGRWICYVVAVALIVAGVAGVGSREYYYYSRSSTADAWMR